MKKIAILLLLSCVTQAKPYKYSSCGADYQIKHPLNSQGVYFSKDCSTAYVLPPRVGDLQVRGVPYLQVDANTCTGMTNLRATAGNYISTFKTYSEIAEAEAKQLQKNLALEYQISEELRSLAKQLRSARSQLAVSLSDYNLKLSERNKLEQELNTCSMANICHSLQFAIVNIEKELAPLERSKLQLENLVAEIKESINDGEQDKNQITAVNASLQTRLGDTETRIELLKQRVQASYDKHLTRVGALLNIKYDMDHTGLVNQYQAENTGIRFEALTAKFSKLHPSIGIGNDISGPYRFDLPATTSPNTTFEQSMYFGAAASGTIQLSLNEVAACALLKPNSNEIDLAKLQSAEYLNIQNLYQYEVAGELGYNSSFNVAMLFEQIKRSGTKGGFFSKRRWSEVINNSEYKALFDIRFFSDDNGSEYDSVMQAQIIADEKALAVDTLFKEFLTLASNSGNLPMPTVTEHGQNGAQATATALSKCPYLYCQVGASVATVLDSIFGSSTASSHFKDTKKFDYKKNVNVQRMYLLNGASGYVYRD